MTSGYTSKKSMLVNLGIGAASMSAIVAAYMMISPVLQSDPPPFASIGRVQLAAQTIQQTQKLLEQTAQTLRRLDEKQDKQDLDYWSAQLAIAEVRLKAMPSDELARGMEKIAREQLIIVNDRITKSAVKQ